MQSAKNSKIGNFCQAFFEFGPQVSLRYLVLTRSFFSLCIVQCGFRGLATISWNLRWSDLAREKSGGYLRFFFRQYPILFEMSSPEFNCSSFVYVPVCMYRGHPLWRSPWDRAFQLGQGEEPIGIVDPISQPRGTIDTASLTLGHTYALVYAFWSNFNLGS